MNTVDIHNTQESQEPTNKEKNKTSQAMSLGKRTIHLLLKRKIMETRLSSEDEREILRIRERVETRRIIQNYKVPPRMRQKKDGISMAG